MPKLTASSVDRREFRDTIGLFATGVPSSSTQAGDEVHAMTASAVTSLSLEPTLVLFCPARKARWRASLDRVAGFSINFLREEQQALSSYFAGALGAPRSHRRFASCRRRRAASRGRPGEPRLPDRTNRRGRRPFDRRRARAGAASGHYPAPPLLFFGGEYRSIGSEAGRPAPDLASVQDEPARVFYEE